MLIGQSDVLVEVEQDDPGPVEVGHFHQRGEESNWDVPVAAATRARSFDPSN